MKIEFRTDTVAFEDGDAREETCRILDEIRERVDAGSDHGTVYDLNGNRIGEWSL